MDRLGIILDATHLCDESFWEALDRFDGPVWASHNNCRALVPNDRQFSDEQIRALVDRGAVIGGVLDAWMLVSGWRRGETTPESSGVKLGHLLDHMDHICQLTGSANHIGIGTDLDGGYGLEQSPGDMDTIADLQRLPEMLEAKGYSSEDVIGVMHGNFMRFLNNAWS
jgi:membrane dipeptidase